MEEKIEIMEDVAVSEAQVEAAAGETAGPEAAAVEAAPENDGKYDVEGLRAFWSCRMMALDSSDSTTSLLPARIYMCRLRRSGASA